jgi:protein-L-isoaspartate(D-aspartate) O-methyltransferase
VNKTLKASRTRLDRARAFYARLASARGGALRHALEAAFARVPRERFLGPPPWYAVTEVGYVTVPHDDASYVYQDVLFALDRAKGINNGEPSLHGQLIGVLAPRNGDLVLHIGCGTGYYTAILAELVGPSGRVIAYEVDPDLAERAAEYLKEWPNVKVEGSSGTLPGLPAANAIYVNAGATRPLAEWLDALLDGGRLVFPLVTEDGWGATLAITRHRERFSVEVINRVRFIGCVGATNAEEGRAVADAFRSGELFSARSLCRDSDPDDTAVLVGDGWWLSSRTVRGADRSNVT